MKREFLTFFDGLNGIYYIILLTRIQFLIIFGRFSIMPHLRMAIFKLLYRRKYSLNHKNKIKHVFWTYRILLILKFKVLRFFLKIFEPTFFFWNFFLLIFFATSGFRILTRKKEGNLKIGLKCSYMLVLIELVSVFSSFISFLRYVDKCKNFPLAMPHFPLCPTPPII